MDFGDFDFSVSAIFEPFKISIDACIIAASSHGHTLTKLVSFFFIFSEAEYGRWRRFRR